MALIDKIKSFWFKIMANQLRQPSGFLAKLTGHKMNKANELLYHLTLNNLQVKDGDSILEIGFGNGKHFADLNEKANNLSITGIDHSAEMISEAQRINKKLFDAGTLKVFVGSSASMPFQNNSFDTIFCVNVIYFWEDPALHLKEIHRVLKPGGIFCTGFRPKENLLKFSFSQFGFTLYSIEDWKSIIEENGFKFVKWEDGRSLEHKMKLENTPFESLCIVCVK